MMQRRALSALSVGGILGFQARPTKSRWEAAIRRPKHQVTSEEDLFVGIDIHKNRWHVTIRTFDVEVFSASIPGTWEALQRVVAPHQNTPRAGVSEDRAFCGV